MAHIKTYSEFVNESGAVKYIELKIGEPVYAFSDDGTFCGTQYYAGNGMVGNMPNTIRSANDKIIAFKPKYIVPNRTEGIEVMPFDPNELRRLDIDLDGYKVGDTLMITDIMPNPDDYTDYVNNWHKELMRQSAELSR